jgi:O-antigen/teichoic acid export membrane protein
VGLRSFFVRAIACDASRAPELFAEQLGLRLVLASMAGALAVLVSMLLGYPVVVQQCTLILSVAMLFTAISNVVSDLLQGREQLTSVATINLVAGLFLTVASFVAAWSGVGPIGVAVGYLVGPLISGAVSLALVHRRWFPVRATCSTRTCLQLLRQAKMLGVQQIVATLGTNAENLLVPKLAGVAVYGQFAAGTLLTRRLEIVPDGLSAAFYPVIARHYNAGDGPETLRAIKRFALLLTAACVPTALALFLVAGPISMFLFPENPSICRFVIQVTAWWVPLLGCGNGMGYALNAAGREQDEARLSILSTIAGLIMAVILVTNFGLVGACYALLAKSTFGVLVRVPVFVGAIRRFRPAGIAASAMAAR